jgi:hypothetical protein
VEHFAYCSTIGRVWKLNIGVEQYVKFQKVLHKKGYIIKKLRIRINEISRKVKEGN